MNFADFYVYQHRKADTNEIFYVGKGTKKRLHKETGRNAFWHSIVNKHGFKAEIIFDGLAEELAFLAEEEVIDRYKRLGIKLCNLSNGGIGGKGCVRDDTFKQKLREKNAGKTLTYEHRQKISSSNKGNKCALGFKHNEDFCKKASENAKKRIYTDATRKKMSDAAKKRVGRVVSVETRIKISNTLKAKKNV
jgi:hypothetical protein